MAVVTLKTIARRDHVWGGPYTPVLLVSTVVVLVRELMAYSPRLVPFSSFRSGFLKQRHHMLFCICNLGCFTRELTPCVLTVPVGLNQVFIRMKLKMEV